MIEVGHNGQTAASRPILQVANLSVDFRHGPDWVSVVNGVSFDVRQGETLGIVGESGSGKTVTTLALLGLLGPRARVRGEHVAFEGRDLLTLSEPRLRKVRGRRIGIVFQEPRRSLDPAFTVGYQIAEVARRHLRLSREAAWTRAIEMLDLVGIPMASKRARDYPHMFSGGMCQRVMLAMALVCDPAVLIADEPTTGLDVTVQAEVLTLILDLQDQFDVAVVFVTHDLAVIAEICERVVVMYAGQIVEEGQVADLFEAPQHPYTSGLLAAIPTVDAPDGRLSAIPGRVPPPDSLPPGCRFAPRCAYAQERCESGPISMVASAGRWVRCCRSAELTLAGVSTPRGGA